jgi:hypothetical protein
MRDEKRTYDDFTEENDPNGTKRRDASKRYISLVKRIVEESTDKDWKNLLKAIKQADKNASVQLEEVLKTICGKDLTVEEQRILTATALGIEPEYYKIHRQGNAQTTNQLW